MSASRFAPPGTGDEEPAPPVPLDARTEREREQLRRSGHPSSAARRGPSGKTRRNSPDDRRPRLSGWRALLRDLAVILVAAILISFLVKSFLIRSFYIPSESMQNTLLVNDRIIVNELVPGVVPLQHGDIVVFTDPGDWLKNEAIPRPPDQGPVLDAITNVLAFVGLSSPDSDNHLIKRVIGLPGDKVTCCNTLGQVSVNGVPLKEPYILLPAGQTEASTQDFSVTVPEGKLWVMGDNRDHSADSRAHLSEPGGGFVPESDVVGRAFVISWPSSRWTWLSNYPMTFAAVPKAAAAGGTK